MIKIRSLSFIVFSLPSVLIASLTVNVLAFLNVIVDVLNNLQVALCKYVGASGYATVLKGRCYQAHLAGLYQKDNILLRRCRRFALNCSLMLNAKA